MIKNVINLHFSLKEPPITPPATHTINAIAAHNKILIPTNITCFIDFSISELLIAEIDAEETLEEHENSEPKENANASDTDDADNSSNTAINKATDFS